MRKILSLIVVCLIVLGGLEAGAVATSSLVSTPQHKDARPLNPFYVDELDQYMTNYGGWLPIGWYRLGGSLIGNISVAQTFVPTKEVLTRIQFLMAKNATAQYPCSVVIRDNITGQNLAVASVPPSAFPLFGNQPENFSWITFDINDIWVIPGHSYSIIMYTVNSSDNFYYCAGNGTGTYLNGSVFVSYNDGQTWTEIPDADGCFKTYGLRETFLQITPDPTGHTYTITNIGNVSAWDVESSLSITGGIFGLINKTFNASIPQLEPNHSFILTMGLVFGLGPIQLKLVVRAANVREMSVSRHGIILLIFIILK